MQGELEAALARLVGRPVQTAVAGRTDAGVHASGQVVHADVPRACLLAADVDKARHALDRLLPRDVAVRRVRRVPATFHARFSATQRRYAYRLSDAQVEDPLTRHVTWHVGPPQLDLAAMRAAGAHLLGEHDFASFCRKGEGTSVRRVDAIAVRRRPRGLVLVSMDGAAFCHQMVRSIVGSLLAVGRHRHPPDWLAAALAARDRAAAAAVAPPHGLTLVAVRYTPAQTITPMTSGLG